MKICFFGSSFNPPHIGHLQIVEGLKKLNFDKILIVPTGNPEYKKIDISTEMRMKLVESFIRLCNVDVSYHEIENHFSYTVESLKYLEICDNNDVYFALGGDSVNSLPSWEYFSELKEMVTFVIVKRNGYKLDESVLKKIKYMMLDVTTTNISSSSLRTNVDQNYIPNEIYKIIKVNNLY